MGLRIIIESFISTPNKIIFAVFDMQPYEWHKNIKAQKIFGLKFSVIRQ